MTRQEEIKRASKIFYASSDDYTVYKKGFESGAEWADKTMIEKACNYLLNYIKDFDFYTESDVETFRKAMEE